MWSSRTFLIVLTVILILMIDTGCVPVSDDHKKPQKAGEAAAKFKAEFQEEYSEYESPQKKILMKSKSLDENEFPWPLPKPSASHTIPRESLVHSDSKTLIKDVVQTLEKSLKKNGYTKLAYHSGESALVLVTRLERINPDGTSSKKNRWNTSKADMEFSVDYFITSLFDTEPGQFRIIAFLLTTEKKLRYGEEPELETAKEWYRGGFIKLPDWIGLDDYTTNYNCIALIYEFVKSKGYPPFFRYPSDLTGIDHLKKSNLWEDLGDAL